ncbi:PAS domain S-box protein [Nitrospira sp. CMX1]
MTIPSGGWIIAAVVFGIDLLLPMGYAVPMLYVLPILLSGSLPGRHSTILLAGSALLLTWIGAAFSPGELTLEVVTNRAMASALLLIIGWLLLLQKQSTQQIIASKQERNGSEERLRLAMSAGNFGTFDWDIPAQRVIWSPETERIWGLPVGGFEGTYEHWRRLVHPDDVEEAERIARLSLEYPDISYAFDHRIVRPDGTIRWIHAKATTLRDAAGRAIRMVGVNQDITERKQAEETLCQLNKTLEQRVAERTAALNDSEQQLKADLKVMTVLNELGQLSLSEDTKPPVLEQIVDAAIVVARSDFGNIQLLDPESGHLKIVAERGFPDWWVKFWNEVPKGQGACGTALQRAQRVIIDDVRQSPIYTDEAARDTLLQVGVCSVVSTPLTDRSGKLIGMFSTHYKTPIQIDKHALARLDLLARQVGDFIERARTQTALRESEERFRKLFEHAAEGIAITDERGNLLQCNAAFCDITGYSAQELVTRQFSSLIHPEDRAQNVELVQQLLERKRGWFRVENRYLTKSGSPVWVQMHVSILFSDRGRPLYFVALVTDITQRKRDERLLQSKEAFTREVLDSLSAHVCVLDRDGVIIRTNQPWKEFAQVNSDTLRTIGAAGDNYLEVCRRAIADGDTRVLPILSGIEAVLAGRQEVFSAEYPCHSPDEKRWFLLRVSPLVESQGVVLSHLDISDRKRVEETLYVKQRELERSQAKLEELTAKLLMAQETERRRLACELHDDITQRVATVAIDLQGIRSVTPGSEASLLAHVHQAGKMAEQITTDLQRLAHQLHPSLLEHVGLEAAVQEYVEEFEARTGLKTKVQVRNLPTAFSLDRATCLYRVLQESLQNVRKHASATYVVIRLLGSIRGVGLCVHDDGRGFDQNHQTSNGRKGLGLISMEERVGALQGTFRLKTKPDDGTEVHAWVPLGQCEVSSNGGAPA